MTALIGWWYATGPSDLPYSSTNQQFHHHTVVAEEADGLPAHVLVENGANNSSRCLESWSSRLDLLPVIDGHRRLKSSSKLPS